MNKNVLTAFAVMGTMLVSAGASFAQDARQKDKNNMRNLGTVLGAAAVFKALKGDNTTALILGAGAAYAGKKYEDQRKAQAEESRWRQYRYNSKGKRIGYYEMHGSKRVRYVGY